MSKRGIIVAVIVLIVIILIAGFFIMQNKASKTSIPLSDKPVLNTQDNTTNSTNEQTPPLPANIQPSTNQTSEDQLSSLSADSSTSEPDDSVALSSQDTIPSPSD